ncbi:MAG: hypothetical protein EOP88_01180 [Verrucomicrobiaceae bacterium]|nr:MAG: hypothetical protein EOP88_01180 [Verrucomicrobiaceae bacterium]
MQAICRSLLPVLLSASFLCPVPVAAEVTKVEIRKNEAGEFSLIRNGQPYVIRGAGGSGHLNDLVKFGGNSIRTWGGDSLDFKIEGKPLLDVCQELGISVTAGIWIAHQRHGFDYSDTAQVEKQRTLVRETVRKHRGHPAILMWGLGNEMEGPSSDGNDPRVWKELNVLAAIVKEEDPAHPVMTVIAGAAESKVKGILEHYPNIDVLGVNAYSGASGAARAVKAAGWKKPFVLTEFGPQGHWEVPKTSWGAPVEPTSQKKAASYYAAQSLLADDKDICLGSYVFLWGQKQEVTSTWYGMFLRSGEKLPTVDAMCRAWTGKWPDNRSPRVTAFDSPLREATVAPGQSVTASVTVTDPENDTLAWEWAVIEESSDKKEGGDAEAVPPAVKGAVTASANGSATIRTPDKPGAYRLFVTVRDGKGGASADNIPFQVR